MMDVDEGNESFMEDDIASSSHQREEECDEEELRQAIDSIFHHDSSPMTNSTTVQNGWITLQNHLQKQPPTASVREALSFLTNAELSKLTGVLCMAMEDRVESQATLSMTLPSDDGEEEEDSATAPAATIQPTLSRTALVSATVYAQLIAMPGALGVGLIEMETLSGGLMNVLQRWRIELIANYNNNKNRKEETKNKTNKNQRKRKKNNVDHDDYEEDEEEDADNRKGVLTAQQLWSMGLRLTNSVLQVPLRSREFASWNNEAINIIIECIAKSTATVQAATAQDKNHEVQNATLETAKKSLESCVCLEHFTTKSPSSQDVDEDSSFSFHHMLQKRHDRTVTILRGLLPSLILLESLPQGESGKIAAATSAAHCLEHLVQVLHHDLVSRPAQWSTSTLKQNQQRLSNSADSTPSTPKSSTRAGDLTPKTTHKKKLRRSIGSRSQCASAMTPQPKSRPSFAPQVENVKPRLVFSAILGLLQKLSITKGLEKASFRTCTVQTLHRCISKLPLLERSHFLNFLIQLCHSKISVHRLVACELFGCILLEDWLWSDDFAENSIAADERSSALPHSTSKIALTPFSAVSQRASLHSRKTSSVSVPLKLFGALQGRLVDKAPTIRAVAANGITNISARILEAFSNNQTSSASALMAVLADEMDDLLHSLRRRAISDEKATVRKAACVAMVELLIAATKTGTTSHEYITDNIVQILGELCQDSSLMTRKTAAECLTRLLLESLSWSSGQNRPFYLAPTTLLLLQQTWTSSVLTMVLDSETSCVAKGVELAEQLILFPIVSDDGDADEDSRKAQHMAWKLLSILADSSTTQGNTKSANEALRVALDKSLASSESGSYMVSLFKAIHRVAVTTLDESLQEDLFSPDVEDQRAGVWCLFEAAMGQTKDNKKVAAVIKRNKLDFDFLGKSWDRLFELFTSQTTPEQAKSKLQPTMRHCLKILSRLAQFVDIETARTTSDNLLMLIGNFVLSPDIIGPAIAALVSTTIALMQNQSHVESNRQSLEWIRELYQKCETTIASFAGRSIHENDVSTLARTFFTVGELSMIGFDPSESTCKDTGTDHALQQQNVASSHRLPIGFYEKPGKQLVAFVQAFMSDTLPGLDGTLTPSSVRAHAFVALGKICLRDDSLARQSLNVLARELQNSFGQSNWIVQSNSLLVLGDLCVRYTSMVDRFLPVMAACLQAGVTDIRVEALNSVHNDGSELVRKHAVLVLSSLLLQDYIKWRGLLFHRFLVASTDEDDEVAKLAEMVLFGPLYTKQPKLFSNQFVESMFVLNHCTAHPIYQTAATMGDGGSGITVGFDGINVCVGEAGRVRRMSMYQMMLSKMTDEEKIGVCFRIGKEILGGALESGSTLNLVVCMAAPGLNDEDLAYESARCVLSDAFAILSSPWIRVGKARDEDDIEDPNISSSTSNKRAMAVKGLLSTISRKHLVEILLPILCNLKVLLQKSCSPLLRDLMACLLDVYQRYKKEALEVMANDPITLAEIEYDAQRQKKALRRGVTPMKGSVLVAAEG